MEKGIITSSTQERLMKLENEKAILEDKVEYEQNHQIKPLEKEQIVNFLKVYAKKNNLITKQIKTRSLIILF